MTREEFNSKIEMIVSELTITNSFSCCLFSLIFGTGHVGDLVGKEYMFFIAPLIDYKHGNILYNSGSVTSKQRIAMVKLFAHHNQGRVCALIGDM